MSNKTNSSGFSSPKKKTFTVATSMSAAFSETASMSSAAINLPDGHPATRANTVAGDDISHPQELIFHHIEAKLRQVSFSTARTALSDGCASSSPLRTTETEMSEYVPEHSFWGDDAESRIRQGLAKLSQWAEDMNKYEPKKSIEEHFSQRLAQLIKDNGVKFDPSYLN